MRRPLMLTAIIVLGLLASAASPPLPANPAAATPTPVMPPPTPEQIAARAAYNAMPDTPGTGPYAARKDVSIFPGHVVYRPKNVQALHGRKLAIVAWGNGGCSNDGTSARFHLSEIASHGYLVIAPGSAMSGLGEMSGRRTHHQADSSQFRQSGKPGDLTDAIDWAIRENGRKGSILQGHVDTTKVAVSGRSCGGLQALAAAADSRVQTVVIHNSGTLPEGVKLPFPGLNISKDELQKIRSPILYVQGGPTDIAYLNGRADFGRITAVPAMIAEMSVGHDGTFMKLNRPGFPGGSYL